MLFQQFARDEWEVVMLAILSLYLIIVFLQLVFKLFLVIEEKELVLQHLTAANLHVLLVRVTLRYTCQVLAILLNLRIALLTLLLQVLAHLLKVILKQIFIINNATDGNTLSKTNHIGWGVFW